MLKSIIAALIVASAATAFVSKAYAGPTGQPDPVLHGARVAEPRQRRQRQQLSDAIRQSLGSG